MFLRVGVALRKGSVLVASSLILVLSGQANADGYDAPESSDYNQLVDFLVQKLSRQMKPDLYPDLQAKKVELIEEMPFLSDETDSSAEFAKLKKDLKVHGGKIEAYRAEIQDVCKRLDALDVYARNELLSSKLMRSDQYEQVIKPWINSSKQNCLTATKDGQYWNLYNEAIELLNEQTGAIPSAEAECRDKFPDRC